MTHPTDTLKLNNGATIILTPCPGTKTCSLTATLQQFKQQGVTAIISLTPMSEMKALNVAHMPELCKEQGILWFHAPVDDHQAPSEAFAAHWPNYNQKIHHLLDQQQTVALHCQGGQGRTGLLAAQLLIERGMSFEEAKTAVKAIKPGALTIEKQTDYLIKLAQSQHS